MNVKIYPSKAVGEISAPPSKSLCHRALICASLTDRSLVKNSYVGNGSVDVGATLNCLMHLGANICVHGRNVTIGNYDPFNIPDEVVLDCCESGSTLRFLIPLCLLADKRVTLIGEKRLFERPLGIYEDICREQGIEFIRNEDSLTLCGRLKSGVYNVRGDISSQFITGLLFALPLLDGVSIIEIIGRFESESYVDLTLMILEKYGIKITRNGNRFIILGNQKYKPYEYTVEGDCSNAAFLQALDFLGGDVTVNGIDENTLQGDRVFKEILNEMKSGKRNFDLSDCPDLAPILFAVSAAIGVAEFTGTKRLKIKESDRALAMKQELKKVGIELIVEENRVVVCNGTLKAPTEPICSHNDHRIVMAMAVLCTLVGGEIEGAEACSKSYKSFFDDLEKLNIKLERS